VALKAWLPIPACTETAVGATATETPGVVGCAVLGVLPPQPDTANAMRAGKIAAVNTRATLAAWNEVVTAKRGSVRIAIPGF
jgi:hypothetical protein